jgi:beta-aspartyl-peptidase (threonine type)
MPESRWAIIVHGGARTVASGKHEANRAGCLAAARAGAAILSAGGSALDAAEEAVRHLEDDTTFNAGSGSVPTAKGDVEMDAAIMDGNSLDIGAVAAVTRIRNPVGVARLVMAEPAVLVVGAGAEDFARSKGIAEYDVPAASDGSEKHDTVGCVAMDVDGHFAAATSTGGLPGQIPGRVGDAPIPGCGFYADDRSGGVAISGDGESILRTLLATKVIAHMDGRHASEAVAIALRRLARVGGEAGIIAIDAEGRFGVEHNSDHFAVAAAADWLPDGIAGIMQDEVKGHLSRG